MKKFVLLSFVFCFSFFVKAQIYIPTLDSINVWSYTGTMIGVKIAANNGLPCPYPQDYYTYARQYTFEDTVINSFLYKKLYSLEYANSSNTDCLMGWVREDSMARKIYFRDVDTIESILYDYNMQLNDSIYIKFYQDGFFQTGYYRLDSIKTVTVNLKQRRQFDLNCKVCSSSNTLSCLEGIGNRGDFVYSYCRNWYGGSLFNCDAFPYDFSQLMTCFEHKTKVYYDSCALSDAKKGGCINYLDSCNYSNWCGSVNELKSIGKIIIDPNPAQSNINLNIELYNTSTVEVFIFDITGRKIIDAINIGKLLKGKSIKNVDVSVLKSGLYFVECRTEKGSLFQKIIIQK